MLVGALADDNDHRDEREGEQRDEPYDGPALIRLRGDVTGDVGNVRHGGIILDRAVPGVQSATYSDDVTNQTGSLGVKSTVKIVSSAQGVWEFKRFWV